jgi:FlaG/FlaF family flagellin (archaellin)
MLLIVETILGIFIAVLLAMTLARFIENRVMNIKSKSFRANQRIVVIKSTQDSTLYSCNYYSSKCFRN